MPQVTGAEDEYELQVNPFVFLILGAIACVMYVFGANERKLWKRNATDHLGKWDFVFIVWLFIKSVFFYVLSTVTTAVASICTIAALRNKEYTTLFEEHGLTAILASQFLLYNVLNISILVRILKR